MGHERLQVVREREPLQVAGHQQRDLLPAEREDQADDAAAA